MGNPYEAPTAEVTGPPSVEERPFFGFFLTTRFVALASLALIYFATRTDALGLSLSLAPDTVWLGVKLLSNLVLIMLALLRSPLLPLLASMYMVWGLVEHLEGALAGFGGALPIAHLFHAAWAVLWLVYFSTSTRSRQAWSTLVSDARKPKTFE